MGRPFIGEFATVVSPADEGAAFTIRRCTVREHMARERVVSDVQQDAESGVKEKDFRIGDLESATVLLGLHAWNCCDDERSPVPINRDTIESWLSPDEYDFLLAAIVDVNPIWRSGGMARLKEEFTPIFDEQLREIDLGIPLSKPTHPYVDIWIHCRRYSTSMSGAPALPQSGSYLDQDAELMLAFDILNDLYDAIQVENKARKEAMENAPEQRLS